jgi:hypothetical protein
MIVLRSAALVSGSPGLGRVGRMPAMAASSASTASKASTSENASREAGEILAGLKAVPDICG